MRTISTAFIKASDKNAIIKRLAVNQQACSGLPLSLVLKAVWIG
jgi:hypothetical protein